MVVAGTWVLDSRALVSKTRKERHLVLLARDGWKIERVGLLCMFQEKKVLRIKRR
jgi:hypothetical protein